VFYLESQALLKQKHQGLILNQKTHYNLLRKKSGDAYNLNIITALLKKLNKVGFIYKIRTEDEINKNKRIVKRKLI
jgi:hypothetical protein